MIEKGLQAPERNVSSFSAGPAIRIGVPTPDSLLRTLISHLRAILVLLCSFETVFVAVLFVGLLKEDHRFSGLPIDLTVGAAAINLFQGLYILIMRRRTMSKFALFVLTGMLLFVAWVLLSLVWTPSASYGPDKAIRIAVLGVWAYIGAGIIIGGDLERKKRFYTSILIFAMWMAAESIVLYLSISPRRALDTFGGHYIGIGRTLGYGICIATIWLITSKAAVTRLLHLALMGSFVFVTMVAGARGPVLATLLALIVPAMNVRALIQGRLSRAYKRYAAFAIAALAILPMALAIIISTNESTATLRRFEVLFTQEGGGSSASGRTSRFMHAVDQIAKSPLVGGGIGSFPVQMGAADAREYPHNIVLELLAELGTVGFALWLAPFLIVLWRLTLQGLGNISTGSGTRTLAVMFLVGSTANAMISGDIDSNRMIFVSLGLVVGSLNDSH